MVKLVDTDTEVEVPSDVTLTLTEDKIIKVKGKKGTVTKDFGHAKAIQITKMGNTVYFHADFPRKQQVALVGTLKNIVLNMFRGVQEGYVYKMKIVYSHFPITVQPPKKGKTEILIKNFIGERAPRVTHSIGDVVVKANKEEVIVSGADKEMVGQTCANIQKLCKIKDNDKRVFKDGVYVFEKTLGDKQLWAIK